jgi:hypothetical protein
MLRMRACLVWLIAGCGFASQPSSGGDPTDPGGPAGPSDPADPTDPGGTGGSNDPAARCDVSDPALRMCLSFSGPRGAQDLVSPDHTVAVASNVAAVAGITTGAAMAASFNETSQVRLDKNRDFDAPQLTFDFFMSADRVPDHNARFWMVDNRTAYAAYLDEKAVVHCQIGGGTADSSVALAPGDWHHVACTYDADHQIRVLIDGAVRGCDRLNPGVPAGGPDGIAIGASFGAGKFSENFVGKLDGIHVYARALPPGELCTQLGKVGCNDQCQKQGLQADPLPSQ